MMTLVMMIATRTMTMQMVVTMMMVRLWAQLDLGGKSSPQSLLMNK